MKIHPQVSELADTEKRHFPLTSFIALTTVLLALPCRTVTTLPPVFQFPPVVSNNVRVKMLERKKNNGHWQFTGGLFGFSDVCRRRSSNCGAAKAESFVRVVTLTGGVLCNNI